MFASIVNPNVLPCIIGVLTWPNVFSNPTPSILFVIINPLELILPEAVIWPWNLEFSNLFVKEVAFAAARYDWPVP